MLKKMLQLMGVAIYETDGYEADDILGTFARISSEKGIDAYLVTGDRDALQLVSPGVKVIITKKGISDVQIFDVDEVKREYGLTPLQIIDMKALMGDSSDNIPGVPGVGKTAPSFFMSINRLTVFWKIFRILKERNSRKI